MRARALLVLALALGVLLGAGGDEPLRVALEDGRVIVRGAPTDAPVEAFAVIVDGADRPLLGRTERDGERIVFTPRFPLEPGLRYRVTLHTDPPRSALLEVSPRPATEPPRVQAIHPSAREVPENLLKLYVEFSRPMRQGQSYAFLRVLDAAGEPVADPFVEIEPELWDPAGTRLTVLFDPGRLKRGLRPNREVGPPLAAGAAYTLVIDGRWPDPTGVPLGADLRRTFRVTAADREPPDPRRWQLRPPRAGTRDPFCAAFPEPLDHALLMSALEVHRGEEPVPGVVATTRADAEWCLVPDEPWQLGDHALRIDPRLEDMAGNRLGRPFDVERAAGDASVGDSATGGPVVLRFEVATAL